MHFRFVKNAVSLFIYSSLYTSISSSIFCSALKRHFGDTPEFEKPFELGKDMFNLGTFNDKNFLSGELVLAKSELTHDVTYKLVVGSQMTTGSIWFVADVYAGSEYKFTNHNYSDLKVMLTTDYKRHLATNGLLKHGFKVEAFRELEDLREVDHGMVGYPERLYTFLTVSKDVKEGDYVVLFCYGRTFSDDLPTKFKEFKVKVV